MHNGASHFAAYHYAARHIGGADAGTVSAPATVTTVWRKDGVPFALQPLDFVVKDGANAIVIAGSGTTSEAGALVISVPESYAGNKLLVHVENVGADGSTTGKFHGTQVAFAA